MNFNLFAVEDTSFSRLYKINAVPQTILIDNQRKIEHVWMGELSPDKISEIKEILSADRALINQPK